MLPVGLNRPEKTSAPAKPPPRSSVSIFHENQNIDVILENGKIHSIAYSSVVLDPHWIDLEFFGGWEREFEANKDTEALLFFTGPTFETGHPSEPLGMVLHGDLKLSNGKFLAGNRAAADRRAYIAVRHNGTLEFGFGSLTEQSDKEYRLFIGGLHSLKHNVGKTPNSYRGVYKKVTMADIRIIYGFREDGRLEVVETSDGVLLEDLKLFIEAKGFVAAFLPDHASKSRLIVPGRRVWSDEHADWISGGKPSITAMPFMIRVLQRQTHSTTGVLR